MTPVCVGATGGPLVVMAATQTSAPMGLKAPKDLTHKECNFSSFFHKRVSVYAHVCKCVYTNITSSACKL